MTWWDSFETLSRLQTALAIFVSVLGIATLAVKLRADHLKKQSDFRKTEERARLDKELQEQTATALRATAELETRTRPKPFQDRLLACLDGIDPKIRQGFIAGVPRFKGVLKPYQLTELQKLASEPEASQFISLKTESAVVFMDEGTGTPVEFELKGALIK